MDDVDAEVHMLSAYRKKSSNSTIHFKVVSEPVWMLRCQEKSVETLAARVEHEPSSPIQVFCHLSFLI